MAITRLQDKARSGAGEEGQSKKGAKVVLAAALAVVLVVIVMRQRGGSATGQSCAKSDAVTVASPAVAPAASPAPQRPPVKTLETPRIEMSQLVSFSPFLAGRGRLGARAQANARGGRLFASQDGPTNGGSSGPELESAAASLPQLDVRAIVHGGSTPLALIGDSLVGVGDVVDAQWRVVQVHADGVMVESAGRARQPQ